MFRLKVLVALSFVTLLLVSFGPVFANGGGGP